MYKIVVASREEEGWNAPAVHLKTAPEVAKQMIQFLTQNPSRDDSVLWERDMFRSGR